ncbi:hypothetical protein BH09MYX1_BH09MYX1_11300 [soil metagenome]
MRGFLALSASLIGIFAACGARTDIGSDSSLTDAEVEVDADVSVRCATSGGVRLCGGPCPPVPDCLGFGCTSAVSVASLTAQTMGVCWADDAARHARRCGDCRVGEVCIQRSVTQLICTAENVCRMLWDDGVRDVCRYQDFRRYDGRPLVPTVGCISSAAYPYVCGGACPKCPQDLCGGISPDHPFGFCTDWASQGSTIACKACFEVDAGGSACAVFDGPPDAVDAAQTFSACLSISHCKAAQARLPGEALLCLDRNGKAL